MKMIPALVILSIACCLASSCTSSNTIEQKEPVKILVDLKSKGGWSLMEGDSIWWQMSEYVQDSVVDNIGFGHGLPMDTMFGLKNLKPVVIIVDNDTTRHYFGDTLRYNSCVPAQLAFSK